MVFHKDFFWGKSIWIWNLKDCLGGSVDAIIQKCVDNGISNIFIKTADGESLYPNGNSQLTKEMVDAFHAKNIKCFAWAYVYGNNPTREGDLVFYTVEQLGVDGYIFDAESEYEKLLNPSLSAETMLQHVRSKYPNLFLAHAPYPVISSHSAFPYVTFGKYCDAVMPQVYQGEWQMSSADAINRMYEEWAAWERAQMQNGNSDCIKPIAPVMQTYDSGNYVLTPKDITEFFQAARGYMAVSCYEWAHVYRSDCWDAIKAASVDPRPAEPQTPPASQNPASTAPSTQVASPTPQTTGQTAPTAQQVQDTSATTPATSSPTPPTSDTAKTTASISPIGEIPLPGKNQKVTIILKHDEAAPHNVTVTVQSKVALDYIEEFFAWLFKKLGVRK